MNGYNYCTNQQQVSLIDKYKTKKKKLDDRSDEEREIKFSSNLS
jgi:hypothetical protein